ncbi:hypothetical protein BY458DRAFT_496079 [Sporodiniella umbellata]|nr:hypothetical protein BY458DRAFT_496079 [Sporodiniella umbellata]
MVMSEEEKKAPSVVLRSYREGDLEKVDYLFCSTSVPLVYESIRRKLWSPVTWAVWFAVYSCLLYGISRWTGTEESWSATAIKVGATFVWAVIGFSLVFIVSDRVDVTSYVEEARANDLLDPDLYYLNYQVKGNKKEKKQESEQDLSHFWVLEVDNDICGMIGLMANVQPVADQRTTLSVAWKQVLAAIFDLFRLPVPRFLEKRVPCSQQVLMPMHAPRTATITRWAIRPDLQSCGLSTLLLNRALVWAHEHGIHRVYANVHDYHLAAEQILKKRHGFVPLRKYHRHLFGNYTQQLGCRVQAWHQIHADKIRASYKKTTPA